MHYGHLNKCFFLYAKKDKAVISLIFAHKGGFKNIFSQTAFMTFVLSEK